MPAVSKARGYTRPARSLMAHLLWGNGKPAKVHVTYSWNEAGDEHQREARVWEHTFVAWPKTLGDALRALAWSIEQGYEATDKDREVS